MTGGIEMVYIYVEKNICTNTSNGYIKIYIMYIDAVIQYIYMYINK